MKRPRLTLQPIGVQQLIDAGLGLLARLGSITTEEFREGGSRRAERELECAIAALSPAVPPLALCQDDLVRLIAEKRMAILGYGGTLPRLTWAEISAPSATPEWLYGVLWDHEELLDTHHRHSGRETAVGGPWQSARARLFDDAPKSPPVPAPAPANAEDRCRDQRGRAIGIVQLVLARGGLDDLPDIRAHALELVEEVNRG